MIAQEAAMATGPVPKHSNERRRSNKPDASGVTRAQRGDGVHQVTDPLFEADEDWHPLAKRMFNALKMSGQSRFYEPSDWVTAQYMCEAMSRSLGSTGRGHTGLNANLVSSVMSGLSNLLVTEGDRRRVRMELESGEIVDEDEQASVANIADYQARFAFGD